MINKNNKEARTRFSMLEITLAQIKTPTEAHHADVMNAIRTHALISHELTYILDNKDYVPTTELTALEKTLYAFEGAILALFYIIDIDQENIRNYSENMFELYHNTIILHESIHKLVAERSPDNLLIKEHPSYRPSTRINESECLNELIDFTLKKQTIRDEKQALDTSNELRRFFSDDVSSPFMMSTDGFTALLNYASMKGSTNFLKFVGLIRKKLDKSTHGREIMIKLLSVYDSMEIDETIMIKRMLPLLGFISGYFSTDEFYQFLSDERIQGSDPGVNQKASLKGKQIAPSLAVISRLLRNQYKSEEITNTYNEFFCDQTITGALGTTLGMPREIEPLTKYKSNTLSFQLATLIMKTTINYDEACTIQLEKFFDAYQKVNSKNKEMYQIDLFTFISSHFYKIVKLIDILGPVAIHFIHAKLANTAISLDRKLSLMPAIKDWLVEPLHDRFHILKPSKKESREFIETIESIALLFDLKQPSIQTQTDASAPNSNDVIFSRDPLKWLNKHILSGEKLIDIKKLASAEIMKTLIGSSVDMENLKQEKTTVNPEKYSTEQLIKLSTASKSMAQSFNNDIYKQLLYLELTDGSIDSFLHEKDQTNSLGISISEHNGKIHQLLIESKINPAKALNYQKKYRFIIDASGSNALDNKSSLITLYGHLKELDIEIKSLLSAADSPDTTYPEKVANQINKLAALLKQALLKKPQQPSDLDIVKHLQRDLTKSLIKKISANIKALSLKKDDLKALNHVFELSNYIDDITSEINSSNLTIKNDLYYFSVEQWDKTLGSTFFLADEVGCCLATDSFRFDSAVSRRIDDASLFHVAIDESRGKPAALIWLYLAETAEKKIVLVANFYEVNRRYAESGALRIGLLNGLIKFTEQYMKDNPNIDHFIMEIPKYGWNAFDLTNYPIVPINLNDKVGGPFISRDLTSTQNEKQTTIDRYFFRSLKSQSFHLFDHKTLESSISQHPITSLEAILEEGASPLLEKGIMGDPLIDAIIKKFSLQLGQFFSPPLNKNSELKSLIAEIIAKGPKKAKPSQLDQTLFSSKHKKSAPEDPQSPQQTLGK